MSDAIFEACDFMHDILVSKIFCKHSDLVFIYYDCGNCRLCQYAEHKINPEWHS